jgi:hypothetical protein
VSANSHSPRRMHARFHHRLALTGDAVWISNQQNPQQQRVIFDRAERVTRAGKLEENTAALESKNRSSAVLDTISYAP